MFEKYEKIPEQYDKEKDISKEMVQLADWNKCWLDSQTDFEEDSGVLKISMPFLDADND